MALGLVSWAVLTVTPAGADGPSGLPPTSPLSKTLHQLVKLPGGPPGAIALVQIRDRTQIVTAGVGNVPTEEPIGVNDTARIASVSKAFNGAIALSLVSQKRLRLSDTIGKRLPALPKAWSAVTLAQMLDHTSGLPDYIKNPEFINVLRANPLIDLTPMQLVAFVANERLLGHEYNYSDTDNIVVGLMVEAVTGESYQAVLADEVTNRLDLTKTLLPSDVDLPVPYVHGYDVVPGSPPDDITKGLNPALAWASGGMVSSTFELNKFMRAYVGGGFTNAAVHRAQFTFVDGNSGPPGPGANASGLGIFRYRTSCGTVYGHTGNFPGYTLFAAANGDGSRSAEVVINTQLNTNPATPAFTLLRQIDGMAVCAAMRS